MQGNTIKQTGSVSSRRWKIYARRRGGGFKDQLSVRGTDAEINERVSAYLTEFRLRHPPPLSALRPLPAPRRDPGVILGNVLA